MSHFVCRCGSNRFATEPLPPGTGWCRLLVTCLACGALGQVFVRDDADVLRVRTTGPIALATRSEQAPTTTNDCPAAWEFRGVA